MGTGERHPALGRLDVLVGRWTVQPKIEGVGASWSEVTWQEDGLFLRQFSDAEPEDESSPWYGHAPFPVTSLIGLDDGSEEFTMLYADGRGVHRVYRMTLSGNEWTIWREAPGFNQRFVGTIAEDGDAIDGRWEMSEDGEHWHVDFELRYVRER